MAVRIQLLGPVRAWRDGVELDLGGPQQRAVLALLATASAAGQTVSGVELVDGLWGEQPPATADNVIQTYLKRLRRLLEPDRPARTTSRLLQRAAGGYRLDTSHVDLDLPRFRDSVAAAIDADRTGDRHQAAERLDAGLRLWHGPPLADLPSLHTHPRVVGLAGERWTAVARYGEAMLAIGRVADAVPVLAEAASAGPFDEAVHALLVRAYHALGRRDQAFAAYHAVRRRLADELGVDPGPELAAAHAVLLAGDRESKIRHATTATAPAQLPMVTATFAGRVVQLRSLDKLLPDPEDGTGTVRVATIVGAAGIGKTTLAVRWAHQVADRFPDGQLYANLRGFDPDGLVLSPADALQSFLDALQVPPQRIPASPEAQVGLYRSLLNGRRMLVVLDNARDAEQVRPLLPGAPGCLVLVTSRHQLTGLIAAVGAHPLPLDLLAAPEARELLERRLGADRLAAEPAAVAEILDRCRGLPLALAIAAARAATRPQLPLAVLASELRQTRDTLDGFDGEETAASLRAVFSWSMHALTPAAARLFRLLSVHPGPDLATPAAASLAGLPPRPAQRLLAELARAHLLTEHTAGRYAFHDLMRAYATELAGGAEDERRPATQRLLDHYLHTAHAAAVLLEPQRDPIILDPPVPGAAPVQLTDLEHAHAWLAAELPTLVATVGAAARSGFDAHAWRLAWSLAGVLDLRGHWQDQVAVQSTAAEAAVRLGDRTAEVRIRMYLAFAQARLGAFDAAHSHLRRAVALADELGEPRERAHTRSNLGWLRLQQVQHRSALDDYRQAYQLYREAGNTVGEARMLNAIGWIHAMLGEYQEALRQCQSGLALMVELGDRQGQGMVWDSIGYAHHHLGDHGQALACYESALARHREVGDRYLEANTLVHIGDAQQAHGDHAAARSAWRRALSILDELGHPDAEEVRVKLEPLSC